MRSQKHVFDIFWEEEYKSDIIMIYIFVLLILFLLLICAKRWLAFRTILFSKEVLAASVGALVLIVGYIYTAQNQQTLQLNEEKTIVYNQALRVVDQEIISENNLISNRSIPNSPVYNGVKCGYTSPTPASENDAYGRLALVTGDSSILRQYLAIFLPTSTSPVEIRDDLINNMRNDLGIKEVNLASVNNSNSFILPTNCITQN